MTVRVLVTGGAGFLGSHFVRRWMAEDRGPVLNLDALTYAGSLARLADVDRDRYMFKRGDVSEPRDVADAFDAFGPTHVVHFAAESHVTRSETDAAGFHRTNVEGTRVMLEAAADAGVRRFVHISTDEVYGPALDRAFVESDKLPGDGQATSPYAKSKALADDLATGFGSAMEVVVLRPTNCFGPWQHPEKAFGRWTTRAIRGLTLPVWGDGLYVRQWLYAGDLAEAVTVVLDAPAPARVYNVGPRHDRDITNLDLVRWLLERMHLPEDRLVLTAYDRPDHDRRYDIDPSLIEELGWRASDVWERFAATIDWYRRSRSWWEPLVDEAEAIYAAESS